MAMPLRGRVEKTVHRVKIDRHSYKESHIFCDMKGLQPINMMMICYKDKYNGGNLEHVL